MSSRANKKATVNTSSSSSNRDEKLVDENGALKRYRTRRSSSSQSQSLGKSDNLDSSNLIDRTDDEDYVDDFDADSSSDSFDEEETLEGDDELDSDSSLKETPSSKRSQISKGARQILMAWLEQHFEHPYPDENEKEELMRKTHLTMNQINIWFVNSRMRVWKPRIDQQTVKSEVPSSPNGLSDHSGSSSSRNKSDKKPMDMLSDDLKSSLATRINPNNANVTRTNIVGSLPNGLPTPSTVICRGNLPKEAVDALVKWLFDNFSHPYPSDAEKDVLAEETNLTLTQVNNWFINARRRIWKPILQKIKSKGMDKDELLAQGKLAEVAKSFHKDQREEETPTKKRTKSVSNSDQEEVTPKKVKRDLVQDAQPELSTSSHLVRRDIVSHASNRFRSQTPSKRSAKELFMEQYQLSLENQKIEEDITFVHDKYASILGDMSEKNVKLLSHITLLEQKQQQIRLNNELLRTEIQILKNNQDKKTPYNAGTFLIEDLGICL